MRYVIPIILHVAWVVPFVYGYYYAGLAAMLLVALPYIKIRKFDAHIAGIEERYQKPRPPAVDKELREIRKTKALWLRFTFLPADRADA